MVHPRTRFVSSALVCVLSAALTVGGVTPATATESTTTDTTSDPAPGEAPEEAPGTDEGEVGPVPPETGDDAHSSEVTDPLLTARFAGSATANKFFTLHQRTRPVAPGLDLTWFDRYDLRGWYRVHALTADLATPGLRLDYAAPGKVSSPGPLSKAMQRDRAVAGVNGDFFDIGDTGAPLGVGVDRQRGLLHGSTSGWNNAFMLDRRNVARVARTFLEASITRRGKAPIEVTDLNAPTLRGNGIGIYTAAWGAAARSRVLPGAGPRREVVVRAGKVRAKRKRLSSGPIPKGTMHLVGVGAGAKKLGRLKVGSRVAVEYGLDADATRVAIGGNVVLLRNGKVLAPGDSEMHPRTAIGIDRDEGKIIIVAVDGRSSSSRGLTPRETAVLLKRMGAEDGLNLDGGGSSSMMARESGETIRVVNDPSDGRLRSVPNGLGFAFAKGSGRLRGVRVEPVADATDSHRVLRGLSRRLVARGHDETHAPVAARPAWSGSARVTTRRGPDRRTVMVGRRPGAGTVTARAGGASGTFAVQVLGGVHRLEASVPTLSLSGKGARGTVDVRGYDGRGFGTWVEPRDLRLSYDRTKLRVTRNGRGLTVTARVPSTSQVLRISAGGRSTSVGVAVGLARKVRHRLDSRAGWRATAYPAASGARLAMTRNRHGRPGKAVALSYSLRGKKSPRAAYLTAKPATSLPARTRRVGVWVRGDRKGATLRMMLRDASGTRATATLAERVSWRGWRFVSTAVPAGLSRPLDLMRVYAVETRKKRRYSGTLAFDDLTVFTERVATVPATEATRDPMVAERTALADGGLRVAVLSGARVTASAPRSAAVARTRRAMREIVAARPDLVLVNGDLVGRGRASDLAFAHRLIREELDGKVAWRYLPGDGELAPGGDVGTYRKQFGNPVRVFDQDGTRFVLLNSARGTFRLGGFQQLVRLRSALSTAVRDATVRSVVVAAHHSTSDPMPGSSTELADPREAELVEELLSSFHARSGKPAGYIGSHARRFATTRHDGVPQVLAGAVNSPARRARGSFTGWSMVRVDQARDLDVEFRPQVDSLRVFAPATLAVGRSGKASAVLHQAGRRVPVDYPMQAVWVTDRTVHVGPAKDAPASAVLSYSPATGRVQALRAGTAELTVQVNGRRASRTVTVR